MREQYAAAKPVDTVSATGPTGFNRFSLGGIEFLLTVAVHSKGSDWPTPSFPICRPAHTAARSLNKP